MESPSTFITFEQQAQLDHTSFIDAMIPSTHVMIEQKSLGKDLRQAIRQSDGSVMAAYGFPAKMTKSECVAELFRRYGEMAGAVKA